MQRSVTSRTRRSHRASLAPAWAVAALLDAACAGTPAASAAPSAARGDGSASAVAESLAAGGVECTDVSPRSIATYVADAIACTVGSDDVVIRTFGSLDDRDRFLQG